MYHQSSHGALSIQQKFLFEISETSRVQWNGTFRLDRPDPSHRAFCYCGLAADSKRRVNTGYILKNTRLSKRGGVKLKAEESYFA